MVKPEIVVSLTIRTEAPPQIERELLKALILACLPQPRVHVEPTQMKLFEVD